MAINKEKGQDFTKINLQVDNEKNEQTSSLKLTIDRQLTFSKHVNLNTLVLNVAKKLEFS